MWVLDSVVGTWVFVEVEGSGFSFFEEQKWGGVWMWTPLLTILLVGRSSPLGGFRDGIMDNFFVSFYLDWRRVCSSCSWSAVVASSVGWVIPLERVAVAHEAVAVRGVELVVGDGAEGDGVGVVGFLGGSYSFYYWL